MIHFSGEERFARPITDLYAQLTDAAFLVRAMPDSEVVEAGHDQGVWKLKPSLSFLKGALETTLTVAERGDMTAKYVIVGKGIGATSTVEAVLNFSSIDGGNTLVNWTGDITALTGLLKLVPRGLIQATAQKVIADVWAALHKALD